MTVKQTDAEVIVVRAGPTGLMLATELRLRGVATIAVERLEARSEFGKALNIQPRTAEILDLRGLLADPQVKAEGGIQGSHFTVAFVPYGPLDTRYPYQMVLPQARLEEIVERRLLELGGDVRRGWSLDGIEQHENTVTLHGPETLTARYAVACDGGHGSVRKLLGLAFPGTESTEWRHGTRREPAPRTRATRQSRSDADRGAWGRHLGPRTSLRALRPRANVHGADREENIPFRLFVQPRSDIQVRGLDQLAQRDDVDLAAGPQFHVAHAFATAFQKTRVILECRTVEKADVDMVAKYVDVPERRVLHARRRTAVVHQLPDIIATLTHLGKPLRGKRSQIIWPTAQPGVNRGVVFHRSGEP